MYCNIEWANTYETSWPKRLLVYRYNYISNTGSAANGQIWFYKAGMFHLKDFIAIQPTHNV